MAVAEMSLHRRFTHPHLPVDHRALVYMPLAASDRAAARHGQSKGPITIVIGARSDFANLTMTLAEMLCGDPAVPPSYPTASGHISRGPWPRAMLLGRPDSNRNKSISPTTVMLLFLNF